MSAFLKALRRSTRFVFASVVWLHACFLVGLNLPIVRPIAATTRMTVNETAVLVLIACGSILSSYGWKNITVDLCYLYFFPFILLYYVSKVCFRLLKSVALWNEPKSEIAGHVQVVSANPIGSTSESGKSLSVRSVVNALLKPLRQFTLLWCLLLLLSSHRSLAWIALVIVLFHLGRTLYAIATSAMGSVAWLATVESKIREQGEALIKIVLDAAEIQKEDNTLRQAFGRWKLFQYGIALLRNRRRAGNLAIFLSFIIFGGVYLYLAFLFSFAYVGIAKVQGIAYSWVEALVTALFIPVGYSDLPRNVWIKLIGGIHFASAIGLGFGTIYGYMKSKLESLTRIAELLNGKFSDDQVKTKLTTLESVFAAKIPAKSDTSVAASTELRR